jgi:hypothetical protein
MRRVFSVPNSIAIIIGLLASLVVYWQTTRLTPLIDYSYQVENAYRMYRGAVPFRDFFLVVAPGTYAVMSLLMHITSGYSHMINVYYTMFVAFAIILLTYNICLRIGLKPYMSVTLLVPLVFTGQSVYPYPLYDPNVALSILIATYIFLIVKVKFPTSYVGFAIAGFFSVFPVLFKQNTGGVYMALSICLFFFTIVFGKKRHELQMFTGYIFGVLLASTCVAMWLFTHGAFDQYIYQTLTFPSVAKSPSDALHIIASQYREYGVMMMYRLPFIVASVVGMLAVSKFVKKIENIFIAVYVLAICLYAYIFTSPLLLHDTFVLLCWVSIVLLSIYTGIILLVQKDAHIQVFHAIFPFVLLGSAHATFLSHGIVHSSYHMWPFAIIALGSSLHVLERHVARFPSLWIVCRILLIFLTIILGRAVVDNYAMSYVDHSGAVSVVASGKFRGMATPGNWIYAFESMIEYVEQHTPKDARVAFLPGEDPFFAATERINPLRFSLLHSGVYTLDANVIVSELLNKNVEWVVIKTVHQTYPWAWVTNLAQISYWINVYYLKTATVGDYEIYTLRAP